MWLSSSLCPSRPPKIVATWPPPSPLHHLCLVALCHGDAVIGYTSPPKDVETSVAPCLINYKEWLGPAGFIWGLPGNCECLHLYVTRFWEFFQFTVSQSFSLQWLLPFNEEEYLSQGCSGLIGISEPMQGSCSPNGTKWDSQWGPSLGTLRRQVLQDCFHMDLSLECWQSWVVWRSWFSIPDPSCKQVPLENP